LLKKLPDGKKGKKFINKAPEINKKQFLSTELILFLDNFKIFRMINKILKR
tara:strand:+ start:363 stop:515 length:153 start_codon:yes stop_codon:yes gene_type:complete